jgi:hypothetical protein
MQPVRFLLDNSVILNATRGDSGPLWTMLARRDTAASEASRLDLHYKKLPESQYSLVKQLFDAVKCCLGIETISAATCPSCGPSGRSCPPPTLSRQVPRWSTTSHS